MTENYPSHSQSIASSQLRILQVPSAIPFGLLVKIPVKSGSQIDTRLIRKADQDE